MCLREGLALLVAHLARGLLVALVAHEQHRRVPLTVLPRLFQPRVQVGEAVAPRHVVHEQHAVRAPIVGASDGAKRLLACGVPD